MLSILGNSVSAESFLMVLVCLFLIGYFLYKEWPEFKRRMSGKATADAKAEGDAKAIAERMEQMEKEHSERLYAIEREQIGFREMFSRDYIRLNTAEKLARANAKAINDSLEERRIIMVALLAALQGMKELGANGPVTEAVKEINGYLNRQAHINQEVLHDADAPMLNPNM